ncbi:hypothetical protein P3342_013334 [Pyrenophora teres f. teres]|nr:hypothetical protein P3342_013334 [Pyrenophora teres f. teres]
MGGMSELGGGTGQLQPRNQLPQPQPLIHGIRTTRVQPSGATACDSSAVYHHRAEGPSTRRKPLPLAPPTVAPRQSWLTPNFPSSPQLQGDREVRSRHAPTLAKDLPTLVSIASPFRGSSYTFSSPLSPTTH